MPRYLERYLAGEYEQVWAELQTLGAAVREEPVYADALAVARETMRRARANIETLIERLLALGYQFGYKGRDPELALHLRILTDDISDWPAVIRLNQEARRPPPTFASPSPETPETLEELQRQYGLFPLSLVAWYETVGAVNLVGSFPVADPLDPEGFNDLYQYRAACAHGHMDQYRLPARDLDPFWVSSLAAQRAHLAFQDMPPIRPDQRGEYRLFIAPGERSKHGFEGGDSLEIYIPAPEVDARMRSNTWYDLTFVEYLRLCFRWGGFPGLEARARKPTRELAILTEDLRPI